MIESGEKKEEYREKTKYWSARLINRFTQGFKFFDAVRFSYGYTRKTMTYEVVIITEGKGRPEWGAPIDRDVFIVKLGKRIDGII